MDNHEILRRKQQRGLPPSLIIVGIFVVLGAVALIFAIMDEQAQSVNTAAVTQTEIADLRADVANLQTQIASSTENTQQSVQTEIETVRTELANFAADLSQEKRQAVNGLREELQLASSEISEDRARAAERVDRALETFNAQFALAHIRDRLAQLQHDVAGATQDELDQIAAEIETLQGDVSHFANTVSGELASVLSEMNSQLELAVQNLSAGGTAALESINASLNEIENKTILADIRLRLNELREEIARGSERETAEIAADFRELRRDISAFAASTSGHMQASLNEIAMALDGVIEKLAQGGESLIASIDALIEDVQEKLS